MHELVPTVKKKAQAGNELSNILPKSLHTRKKPQTKSLDVIHRDKTLLVAELRALYTCNMVNSLMSFAKTGYIFLVAEFGPW